MKRKQKLFKHGLIYNQCKLRKKQWMQKTIV